MTGNGPGPSGSETAAVRVLPAHEVSTANGFMFGSQFVGIGLGGSGALYVAGWAGFTASFYFILGLMTLLLLFVTIPLREPPDPAPLPAFLANPLRVRRAEVLAELAYQYARAARSSTATVASAAASPGAATRSTGQGAGAVAGADCR